MLTRLATSAVSRFDRATARVDSFVMSHPLAACVVAALIGSAIALAGCLSV